MNLKVTINDKTYPCSPSMGAMLRWEKDTERPIASMDGTNLTDLCLYLYYCVVSACVRENVKFDYDFMTFADNVDQSDLQKWLLELNAGRAAVETDNKKKASKRQ